MLKRVALILIGPIIGFALISYIVVKVDAAMEIDRQVERRQKANDDLIARQARENEQREMDKVAWYNETTRLSNIATESAWDALSEEIDNIPRAYAGKPLIYTKHKESCRAYQVLVDHEIAKPDWIEWVSPLATLPDWCSQMNWRKVQP